MSSEKKATILIVDDTPANIDILKDLLSSTYQIKVATSGEKCLKIAMDSPAPDLILLDIMMPEMDGYEVCERLQSNNVSKDIPVIFVTAKGEIADEVKGFELGAVDYITKPYSPPIIAARVKNHLALHNQSMLLQDLVDQQTESLNEKINELNILSELQDLENASLSLEEAESKLLNFFNRVFGVNQSGVLFTNTINGIEDNKTKIPQFTTEELSALPLMPTLSSNKEELKQGCVIPLENQSGKIADLWYMPSDMRKFNEDKINRFAYLCTAVLKSALMRREIEQGFDNFGELTLD
jgi:DNA-binding response OmpR family regulator